MRARVRFLKPYPFTPLGSLQDHHGTIEGDVVWVECPATQLAPAGKFGVHLASKAVIVPLVAEQPKPKANSSQQKPQ